MNIELPLNEMSVADKLRAMETIWADLSRAFPDETIPRWHADVLAARESRLAAGQEKVLDWDEAKRELRRRLDASKNT